MRRLCLFLVAMGYFSMAFSSMYHHQCIPQDFKGNIYEWEQKSAHPFDELIITWNGLRPLQGYYSLYVSVRREEDSPYVLYAQWGADFQKTYATKGDGSVRTYQDAVEVMEGKKGYGFKVQIRAEKGASLNGMHSIHVSAHDRSIKKPPSFSEKKSALPHLKVPLISQMALADKDKRRMCSPTSVAALIGFHRGDAVCPLKVAHLVHDNQWDIFGNWVLNVAEAYAQLNDPKYMCWVDRLEGFDALIAYLERGFPVAVSLRGPLPGSALPYASGHLLVVTGYDHRARSVLCMDPAFPSDRETEVTYDVDDFIAAWSRRGYIAYVVIDSDK